MLFCSSVNRGTWEIARPFREVQTGTRPRNHEPRGKMFLRKGAAQSLIAGVSHCSDRRAHSLTQATAAKGRPYPCALVSRAAPAASGCASVSAHERSRLLGRAVAALRERPRHLVCRRVLRVDARGVTNRQRRACWNGEGAVPLAGTTAFGPREERTASHPSLRLVRRGRCSEGAYAGQLHDGKVSVPGLHCWSPFSCFSDLQDPAVRPGCF
jgi:hypothetical protein